MKEKIVLIFVVILALSLRIYSLGVNPPSLDWDEASLGYNAYSLLKTGEDEYGIPHPLTLRSFNDDKPGLYIYFAAVSINFFGLNEFAIRLPSALFGATLPVAFYLLINLLAKKKISLIGAFIFSVNPWAIQFSRGAFEANLGLSMLLWGAVLLFYFYKNIIGLLIGAALILSSVYAYHSNKFVAPIAFVVILTYLAIRKKINATKIIIVIPFAAILMIPFMLSIIRGYGLTRFNSAGGNFNLLNLLTGFFNHFNFDFLFINGDLNMRHHVLGFGLFYIFESALIFIGLLYFLRYAKFKLIFATLFLISLLPATLAPDTPHAIRSLLSLPFFLTILVFGFYEILKHKTGKIIVILTYTVFIFMYSNALFKQYPIEAAENWQYGYREVAEYLFNKNNYEKYDKIILTSAYDEPYIYMLLYSSGKFINLKNDGTMSRGFDKFEFKKINYAEDIQNKNTLLIGTEQEIKSNNILKTIYYLDGKIAFKIVHSS